MSGPLSSRGDQGALVGNVTRLWMERALDTIAVARKPAEEQP